MESVMMIFFIILIVFFTYGYSSFYFYKHKTDQKTIFIPKSEEDDSFVVGGQNNSNMNTDNYGDSESSTCDPNASFSFNGDNSMFCLNGGDCKEKLNDDGEPMGIYKCECKVPFVGDTCNINQSVRVDITDNYTAPTEITRVAMFDSSGKNSFIQYNDYL